MPLTFDYFLSTLFLDGRTRKAIFMNVVLNQALLAKVWSHNLQRIRLACGSSDDSLLVTLRISWMCRSDFSDDS